MDKFISFAAAFAVGLFSAGIHFGGLWFTIRYLVQARRPYILAMASFMIRTIATATLCWLVVTRGSMVHGLVWLGGFLLGRLILVRPPLSPQPEFVRTDQGRRRRR